MDSLAVSNHIHIQDYMYMRLALSNYIGAGGQAAGTRNVKYQLRLLEGFQQIHLPQLYYIYIYIYIYRITAALEGRMLNQRSVDSDPQISITQHMAGNE